MLKVIAGLSVIFLIQSGPSLRPDPPIACDMCAEWNKEREPFRVFGNTYYVGVEGLSVALITSDQGHILLDGGLPQSAALIDKNIRKLGFRTEDIRLIVSSHTHFDHVGGIAALQRFSGARVAASAAGAKALEEGMPNSDDPQYAEHKAYPSVSKVRVVRDGETLHVATQKITAHFTPGHTPGGTTWTWRSCEGSRCLNMVYADSLNAVSSAGFRFTGDKTHPSIVETFRRSIATVEQLPCDILIPVHPGFSSLFKNLERRNQGNSEALVDPHACRTYAGNARQTLERRISEER